MHEQETLEKCFSEDVGPNVFSPLERLFPSSAQSRQETRTTDTLTALYSMNKMQRRQLKSVKIPWDKQGFLFKKKKMPSTPITQTTILNYRKSSQGSYVNVILQALGHMYERSELILEEFLPLTDATAQGGRKCSGPSAGPPSPRPPQQHTL